MSFGIFYEKRPFRVQLYGASGALAAYDADPRGRPTPTPDEPLQPAVGLVRLSGSAMRYNLWSYNPRPPHDEDGDGGRWHYESYAPGSLSIASDCDLRL